MTDEPVRIEFSSNAPETAAAIESINAALMKIPEAGAAAGSGIDSFVSRSTSALGRLSAEISRVSGELRSLSSTPIPGTATGTPAPVAPPAAIPPVREQPTTPRQPGYEVRPYTYQPDPRGMMRPVYSETQSASTLPAAQALRQQLMAQGGAGQYATIAPIRETNAALKELSETQKQVAQTPISTPQNVANLQAETQGIQTKNTALTESLTTQRQATEIAQKPVTPPPPLAQTTGADQYIADYKRQQQEIAQAQQQAATTPPVANVAPIQAETAAYQQETIAIKEKNAAQQQAAATPVKPVTPTATQVTTPQTQQASTSLQQEATSAQQATEALTALNAAKTALTQAEASLATSTNQATAALESELAILQQMAAAYRDTATAAGQLSQAQAKVGTATVPPTQQPVTPVSPQAQVVPQQTPPPVVPIQPQQEMTVEEFRAMYGGTAPAPERIGGKESGGVVYAAPEEIQKATQATEQLTAAQQKAIPAAQQMATAQGAIGESAKQTTQAQGGLTGLFNRVFGQHKQGVNAAEELAQAQRKFGTESQNAGIAYGNMGNLIERQASRIAVGLAIWTTFRFVQQVIQEQIAALREYELETSRFAAITGQSVDSARAKWDEYAKIATQAGVKPMEAAPAIRIAELTPLQPGETEQVREQFVRTVTQIEEVTGVASDKIGKGLSSALRQAGQGLGDVAHMGDLVATTLQRIPAANLDNVISALQEAAPLAQLWGTTFDEAFNIIVEGASRVQESPEQISTAFQRLSKGLNEIGQGGSAAWERQSKLVNDFGISVTTAEGKLRPIPEVLGEIARMLPGLSAPRQQALLETVAGGSLRPEQMRNLLGGLEAFNVDLSSTVDKLDGTLNRMTNVIDQSLGQTVKVLDARIAQMREKGGLLENLATSFLRGTLGEYGGKQGAEAVGGFVNLTTAGTQGQQAKTGFLEDIVQRSGGDIEKAKRLTQEYNKQVAQQATDQMSGIMSKGIPNPVEIYATTEYAKAMMISDEEIVKAIQDGGKRIEGAATQRAASERRVQQQLAQARKIEPGAVSPAVESMGTQRTPAQPQRPANQFLQQAQTTMFSSEGKLTGESFFPDMDVVKGSFDAIKYSMTEISQAKMMSVQLTLAELDAQRQLLISWGMLPEKANEYIEAQKKILSNSLLMVKTQRGFEGITGLEAARFQPAMGTIDRRRQQAQQAESNFVFQRHKEIDPSQFGQLQALTAMYDAMLTKMGSPEKSKNINLLLGEENVFKTMTARLSALQMAMEDLTKVEKAQLSGTWNMPAGATALVPISSLDVQRWNKGEGGGGMSPEALMALLEQMGLAAKAAEGEGGLGGGYGLEPVLTSGTDKTVAAINEVTVAIKSIPWYEQYGVKQAVQPPMALPKQPWYEEYGVHRQIAPPMQAAVRPPMAAPVQPKRPWYEEFGVRPPFEGSEVAAKTKETPPLSPSVVPLQERLDRQGLAFEGAKAQGQPDLASNAALSTFTQMFVNNIARNQAAGAGMAGTRGGGGGAVAQPLSDRREDYALRHTADARKETAEDTTRATAQVGQKVDNVNASTRALGGTLMVPLLQMLYQLMQLNAKTGTGGTATAARAMAATTTPTMQAARTEYVTKPAESLLSPLLNRLTDMPASNSRQQALAVQRAQTPPVNVNVSMLPIKATLAANLSVVMDGRVIARALMPLMYDMLTRAARGQSVQPRGVLR